MSNSLAKPSFRHPIGITFRTKTINKVKVKKKWSDDPKGDFGVKAVSHRRTGLPEAVKTHS
jgi:hypothetical protein